MKAAILYSHSAPLSVEEVDLPPVLGAGEAVVEVLAYPIASYAHEFFRAEHLLYIRSSYRSPWAVARSQPIFRSCCITI